MQDKQETRCAMRPAIKRHSKKVKHLLNIIYSFSLSFIVAIMLALK